MESTEPTQCTAFEGSRCIASGDLMHVAVKAKGSFDKRQASVLIFHDLTSEQIEVDFRGTPQDVQNRLADTIRQRASAPASPDEPRGPGRPKLGVVGREVTLLPRHWEWLNEQPGGASVALRKLVEAARIANKDKDRIRRAQESAYRFLSALAGNLPGFEEATRALFARNRESFTAHIQSWPKDIRDHALKLGSHVFADTES